MNPSKMLRRWLDSGTRPISQREASALLDESRSLLVSKLPTTAVHVQNLTDANIDGILAGGKTGMMERAAAVHREKQNLTPSKPTTTMQLFTKASHPIAKKSATPAPRPAPATVASKPAPIHRATATASKPSAPATKAATPAAPQKAITAAEFATPILIMARPEFDKLTPADKSRFFKEGGKLA